MPDSDNVAAVVARLRVVVAEDERRKRRAGMDVFSTYATVPTADLALALDTLDALAELRAQHDTAVMLLTQAAPHVRTDYDDERAVRAAIEAFLADAPALERTP